MKPAMLTITLILQSCATIETVLSPHPEPGCIVIPKGHIPYKSGDTWSAGLQVRCVFN